MEIRLGILSFFINVGNQDNHLELNDYNLGRETLHTNPAFFQASLGWSKLNKIIILMMEFWETFYHPKLYAPEN